jgi:hypothetical protein
VTVSCLSRDRPVTVPSLYRERDRDLYRERERYRFRECERDRYYDRYYLTYLNSPFWDRDRGRYLTVAVYDHFLIDGHKRPRSDKVSQIKPKVSCVINFFPKKCQFNSY